MKYSAADFKKHFTGRSARAGLLLCGAAVAATCLGLSPIEIASAVGSGISAAMSHVPFMPTSEVFDAFFEGAKAWSGGLGSAIGDWFNAAGGEASHRAVSVLTEMRNHLGDKAEAARAFFGSVISGGVEAGTVWFSAVRNTIANNPLSAVEYAGKALLAVAETWGALKGLHEAYSWAARRFGSKTAVNDEHGPGSTNITNIHLNIALSDASNVGDAIDGLVRSVEAARNPEAILIHLKQELVGKFKDLTPETPVMGSDVRMAKAEQDQNFDPFNPMASATDGSVDLIDGDDVIWASREFNRDLRDGMSRSMSGMLPPDGLRELQNKLDFEHPPLAQIEGGIILKMTPKGQLSTTTATATAPQTGAHDAPQWPMN